MRAAGINFADSLMVGGTYQVKPPFPFTPGLEAAGEVIETGDGVPSLLSGQRVLAVLRDGGGYAEEIVLDAATVLPIPESMDFVTAAAFPVAYGTSHFALTHRGHLQPGETLLVLGAAGGVGLTAVEIGKALGARVIAAAGGTDKLAVARSRGADELIDYRTESLRDRVRELTGGKGADVVYDPVGGDAFDQALRAVNWEARMLVIGFASGRIQAVPANLILVKNISVIGVVWGAQTQRHPAWMSRTSPNSCACGKTASSSRSSPRLFRWPRPGWHSMPWSRAATQEKWCLKPNRTPRAAQRLLSERPIQDAEWVNTPRADVQPGGPPATCRTLSDTRIWLPPCS